MGLVGPVCPLATVVSILGVGKFAIVTCVGFSVVIGKVESLVELAEWLLVTLLLRVLADIQATGQTSISIVPPDRPWIAHSIVPPAGIEYPP